MGVLGVLVASACFLPASTAGCAETGQAATVLTTTHAVHSLMPEEARQGRPVHLRVVLTYYDPYIDMRHGALFVHDATGSIFIRVPLRPILDIKPGDELDVVARSGSGDYAPILQDAAIDVIGHGHLPENPVAVTVPQMLFAEMDGQWVEVEGLVHAVQVVGKNVVFELATKEGRLMCTTLVEPGKDYDGLVDAIVRIRGNEAPEFNRNRQLVGAHLYFASLEQVRVVNPAPANPYDTAPQEISKLLQYVPGMELPRRKHVRGRVTLKWPGRLLCVQEGTDGLCVATTETAPVAEGAWVDLLGFPAIVDYRPTLVNATYRVASGAPAEVNARTIDSAEAFSGTDDAALVTMEGELAGVDRTDGDEVLLLMSGHSLISAILAKEGESGPGAEWKEGSRLRVTGICRVTANDQETSTGEGGMRVKSVEILLRSVGDVEVLQTPSWWTGLHTLLVLGIVCLLATAAIAWVVVLREQVAQQTQMLRESEEQLRHAAQHDTLTGLANRALMDDRIVMALAMAQREQCILGLLLVDLDRFKEVNDTLGHQAGDRLLCQVAGRLKDAVRASDMVARMGGDEFIVLLPKLKAVQDAETIAQNIVAAIQKPFPMGLAEIRIGASVGVCTYPAAGLTMERLMHHVDLAMYRAKAEGQSGYTVYAGEMNSAAKAL
jgi:diguanylate cyclase (GGDEF)-like protein